MTLKRKVKLKQSKNAHTQYLIIPSAIVQDSQYPFKSGEEVEVVVDPGKKRVIVEKSSKNEGGG